MLSINDLACQLVVIGQGRISQLGSHFKEGAEPSSRVELFLWVTLVPAAIAILFAVWWQSSQKEEEEDLTSPGMLFRELCRAHHLSLHQQMNMRKLAKAVRASSPSMLFVRQDIFDAAMANLVEDPLRLWWRRDHVKEQFHQLRETLFGQQKQPSP